MDRRGEPAARGGGGGGGGRCCGHGGGAGDGLERKAAAGEGEVVLDGSAVGVSLVCVGLDLDETVVGFSMRRPIEVTVFVFTFSIRVKSLVPLALVHVYSSTAT
jgi:hypothetical protein